MAELIFVHSADFHLDTPFTYLGGKEGLSSKRRQDLKDVFLRVMEIAKKSRLLLICGDLFEHNYIRKTTINFIRDEFYKLSNTYIVILPGNHDPFVQNSYYISTKWPPNVLVLNPNKPYVYIDNINTAIYGMGFRDTVEEYNSIKRMIVNKSNYINIVMFHGSVGVNMQNENFNNADAQFLGSIGADYIALGHYHNKLEGIGRRPNMNYCGSPEPIDFDENGDHGVYLVKISKHNNNAVSVNPDFIKTSKTHYYKFDVNITGCNNTQQVISRISEQAGGTYHNNILVNATLKGYTEPSVKIDLNHINGFFKDKYLFFKIKDLSVDNYNFDQIAREQSLRGLFTRKIFEMIERSSNENEKRLLLDALFYGYEALERGKIDL